MRRTVSTESEKEKLEYLYKYCKNSVERRHNQQLFLIPSGLFDERSGTNSGCLLSNHRVITQSLRVDNTRKTFFPFLHSPKDYGTKKISID